MSTRGPALNLRGGLCLPQMPTFNPTPIPHPSQMFMEQPAPNQFMPPTSSMYQPMPVPPPNQMSSPRMQFGASPQPPPPHSSAPTCSVLNFVPTQLQHRPPMRPSPAPSRGPGFGPGPSFPGPQLPAQRLPGPQFVPRSLPMRSKDDPKVVISAPPTKNTRPALPSTAPSVVEPPAFNAAPPSVSAPPMPPFMSSVPPSLQRPAYLPPSLTGPSMSSSSLPMPVRAPEPMNAASSSKAGPSTSKGDGPKAKPKRVKPYLRVGGGKKWVDPTLSEWDSSKYFVHCSLHASVL